MKLHRLREGPARKAEMNTTSCLFRLILALTFTGFTSHTSAQYGDWKHSGSIYIVTTPEGANLPASAVEKKFPVLVRLNRDHLDFSEVKPRGEDIRFSAKGKPLAYQVERWDAAGGNADVWVGIPVIRGNEQQEIRMHWGNDKALSESDGE